jgi:Integrase core domain
MFTVPEYPLDDLSLDIVDPIPSYQGKKSWVAVVVYRLSRHIWTCMFLTHPSSICLFEFIELEIIEKFQKILLRILTDRKGQFRTRYWTNLLQKYNIQRSLSSTFYGQTDSLTEQLTQSILTKLRILSIEKNGITKNMWRQRLQQSTQQSPP